ncbi:MAG: tripartite tricarboxylate transporter substrate binding protein [Nitrospinaceae bacterium]|jgi:tripartite-type tricarboxylate transporter receptor subunit TctC|nr:tripartite tricarboxylate transporter substrate binding protein [Nitrospinaceae bacterium]MBT4093353.1 tripartite tricarboxylate transporter substrate binding protein [Nitrospinaceae bacterium]MBT5368489.1 tripartite tricarboxylate transporter substrate binding protein [Nitrospinaceae bacterium]MBT6394587.1 tripartite tricarboxylate transporter substrate binding protein [Nitrospinaceae bacterium]MBT7858454.1 tripartite tricarboxylate transporter substrate binding protein [Nitrospinaceae bact
MNRKRILLWMAVLLSFALLSAAPSSVSAEKFPNKPIRLIVTRGAGGGSDLAARAISSVIHEYLGQAMVVQLMPGAGGRKAMLHTLRTKNDGYTLVLGGSSVISVAPLVYDMGYDPVKDFIPIGMIDSNPYFLTSSAKKPWKNFGEFIAHAKKNPGKISYGSSGMFGSGHVFIAKIMKDMGVNIKHVPFRGGGPALRAMMGGHVDTAAGHTGTGGAVSNVKAGKLRALVIGSPKRHKLFPNTPTLKESGVDMLLYSWRAVMAPKGVPADRIKIIEDALKKTAKSKTLKRLFAKMRIKALPLYGDELVNTIKKEIVANKAIIKELGLRKKKK